MMKQGQCLFTFRCVILVYSVRYSTSVQTAALEIPSASLLSSSGSKFSKCKVQECNMALGSWLDAAGATTVAIWYCAVMDIVWRGKEVVLVHAMNSCGGSGGIAPFTLNLGTRWGWVFSITALLISLAKKESRFPLDRRLGEPHRQTGHIDEEKELLVDQMAVGRIFT